MPFRWRLPLQARLHRPTSLPPGLDILRDVITKAGQCAGFDFLHRDQIQDLQYGLDDWFSGRH